MQYGNTYKLLAFLCDIWALGILFYRMSFGLFPFDAFSRKNLIQKIMTKSPKMPNSVSLGLQIILETALHKNPRKRCSLKSIITQLELL